MTRPTMSQTKFLRIITSELEALSWFSLLSRLYLAGCSVDIEQINPKGKGFLPQTIQKLITDNFPAFRLYVRSLTLVNLCPDH